MVTDNCRVLPMDWLAGNWIPRSCPLKVALTAGEAGLLPVPKKPPSTPKDSTPAVPCGMLSGVGPTTPGRTPTTLTWHSEVLAHVSAVPDCSDTLIANVLFCGGTASKKSGMRARITEVDTPVTKLGANCTPLINTLSVEIKFVPVM